MVAVGTHRNEKTVSTVSRLYNIQHRLLDRRVMCVYTKEEYLYTYDSYNINRFTRIESDV